MVITVAHPGYAQDETQEVSHALKLVNKIRQDPLAYAEEIGLDRETLRQELPWLVDILDNGLPDFSPSEGLDKLAREENLLPQQDVIKETGTEDDGELLKNPLGSDLALTGEIGGVVSFYSFMPPEFAWEIVIRNQFEKELKPDNDRPLYILNPGFNSMGVAMEGGREVVGGEEKNAYFVTILFASSRSKAEAQVLNMVNQVRYSPYSIETYMGLSLIKVLNYNLVSLSKWFWLYPPLRDSSKLPPLFENVDLHDSSRFRVTELINPNDPSLKDMNLISQEHGGYEGKKESVAYDVMTPVDATSDQLVTKLFTSLLGSELRAPLRKGAIFSIGTNEGGVGIALSKDIDHYQRQWAGLVLHARTPPVDDLSLTEGPNNSLARIYGVVFSDTNEDKIYSPGEGKEGIVVNVYRKLDDIDTLVGRTFSDASGHFNVALEKGLDYRFEIPCGETPILHFEFVEKDLFLPVSLPVDISPH